MSQPGGTVVATDRRRRNMRCQVSGATFGTQMAGGLVAAELQVDRAQVMAYRVAALGLAERGKDRPGDLPLLDLGVQEYTPGSVQVALAARTAADLDDDRLLMVWAARGAPHLHRRRELAALAKALWPVSDADATARIQSQQIPEGMKLGIAAFTATAEAMRKVVTKSMPRGEVEHRGQQAGAEVADL